MRIILLVCQAALVAGWAAGADTGRVLRKQGAPGSGGELLFLPHRFADGGLRLDSADAVRKGGKSGPPIVPGKPDDSLLIQAIRQTHPRLKMPPGGKLKDEEITAITEWVKAGAVWPGRHGRQSKPATPDYVITPQTSAHSGRFKGAQAASSRK